MKKSPFRLLAFVLILPIFLSAGCAWQWDLDALQKEVNSQRNYIDKVSNESALSSKQSLDMATAALKNAEQVANAAEKAGNAAETANLTLARMLEKPKVYTLNFGFNKSQINYAMRRSLDQIINDWKGKATAIRVVGHADLVGSGKFNLALSRKRAAKVKAALVQGGVSPSIIEALGVGQKELAVQTKRGKRLLFNRRVVLTILPKKS